jgi:lipoprotein-releasing system ATP-binding protein
MADSDMLVELTDVTRRYDSPAGAETPAVLDGVNLRVAAGASVAVVGPSGSGKSTLLNIMGTLDRPTSGQVRLAEKALAEVRNRQIGFVFQLHHLLGQCTALENVLVPTLAAGAPRQGAEPRARGLLERVGLGRRMDYRPGQLSGGERQRVAVVRALINRPQLLLADEPTGSLDRAASDELATLLVELNREQGVTIVLVTHAERVASRMGKVLRLTEGRLAGEEAAP